MPHARIDQHYVEHFHLLTKNEIVVFICLLKARNGKSQLCNPKLRTIARESGIAPPHVSRAVAGLEDKKWVIWDINGCFQIVEKVTKMVTQKDTKSVTTSYQNGNSKIPNRYVEDTKLVTVLNKDIEQTIEQTIKQKSSPAKPDSVIDEVFAFWKKECGHPRSSLSIPDRGKISARLREGYTADDLRMVIVGCTLSPHHQGENANGHIHDSIDLLFRSSANVERFMGYAKNLGKPKEYRLPTYAEKMAEIAAHRALPKYRPDGTLFKTSTV